MSVIPFILEDLNQVRAYANDLLDKTSEEIWFRQPAEGINHVAWQVGHMAIAQYGLCLKRVRGVKPEDAELFPVENYARLFGKGSTPSSNVADYPEPSEIRHVFDLIHTQVLDEIAHIDESILDESAGAKHPMFSTKGEALRFSAKHEMLHVGQIALVRRIFGGEILR